MKVQGAAGQVDRARALIPHEAYADAVLAELDRRLARLEPRDWQVGTIFFGGGTPSLWDPVALGRVVRELSRHLPVADELEVTAECNPTSVSHRHFEQLLEAGINRVSIGVQATDSARLGFLGRLHDADGGLRALEQAREAGVPRVSADLIFGVHRQPPEAAVRDVQRVLQTGVSHVSCYALTIEENTKFGALHRSGRLPLLEDDLVAHSFLAVRETLEKAGFLHYEISNYARPGEESRHNLGYWLGQDYLGLGTGAFGTVTLGSTRLRYRNFLSPERYLRALSECDDGSDPFQSLVSEREELSPQTSMAEAIMLGLRLQRGIQPARLEARTGTQFWTRERRRAANALMESGRLREEQERLLIPKEQWLFADGIIAALL